ncbi:hypothetical protein SAMN02745163_03668 [Clostridium cavendishii DSM 21758]|uniref:Uncharacterized protein n=1 Tax=Clostridium cavendishii DSM 21758 TaxID=1121302 RepID=A0A1M6RTQ8_9CLOT|nr:hypothetical protein [Clostridium cavendishii]SHK35829.1 hypothetical protein SAMN02745163_03668 [Clostridium cavendishii DSM 21758]
MELMALKIPTGYAICHNNFYDVEPEISDDGTDIIDNWGCFTEDILQINKMILKNGQWCCDYTTCIVIDLGWYPDGDINGEYGLVLAKVNKDHSWDIIKKAHSKNRFEIRDIIEEWMELYIKVN